MQILQWQQNQTRERKSTRNASTVSNSTTSKTTPEPSPPSSAFPSSDTSPESHHTLPSHTLLVPVLDEPCHHYFKEKKRKTVTEEEEERTVEKRKGKGKREMRKLPMGEQLRTVGAEEGERRHTVGAVAGWATALSGRWVHGGEAQWTVKGRAVINWNDLGQRISKIECEQVFQIFW